MAAPTKTVPHPGRALAALAALIVIMLLGALGGDLVSPGHWHKDFKIGLGLDLSSGTQVTMRATTPTGGTPSSAEMNQAISVILARVNGTGNSGGQVQTQGSQDLTVSVPGKSGQQTVALVSTTALLTFRQVLLAQGYTAPAATPSSSASSSAAGNASLVNQATLKLFDKLVCTPGNQTKWKTQVGYTNSFDYDNPNAQVVACDNAGDKFALDKAVVPGTQIGSAVATQSNTSNEWEVDVTLKSGGAAAFAKLTAQQTTTYLPSASTNANDQALDEVAIVLDGNIVQAPEINGAIPGGNMMISGGFTQATAAQLQNVLKYGSLPLSFLPLSVRSVSAQLGRAQLDGSCARPSKPAGSAPGARSWSRTPSRSSPRCCCITSPSARSRASPTPSA